MKIKDVIVSKTEPAKNYKFWAKPTNGGFSLYILEAGRWQPIKVVDDKGTSTTEDDTPGEAINCSVVGKTLVFGDPPSNLNT
jgi:hypothetical protein